MATATRRQPRRPASKKPRPARRPESNGSVAHRIIVNGLIELPAEFRDFDAFRRWCMSPAYPERGDVFWIDGEIWVSDEMEDYPTHNAVKTEILTVLNQLVKAGKLGVVFADGMRLVHKRASLSVEPDLMFVSVATVRSRQVRLKPNKKDRILEVSGSPDMVLEVTSDNSLTKDNRLEEKYFAAGVAEYWRVDARGEQLRFEILRRGPKGFVPTPRRGGGVESAVFGQSFELRKKAGALGVPEITLAVSG